MPTVLNYLNFNDPYIAFGNDLFDKNTDRFVVNYVNQNYQYFDGDTILHYDGTTVNGLYHYHTDSLLHNNLKTEVLESKQQEKCQAIIQQYNMRMIKDQLIVQ